MHCRTRGPRIAARGAAPAIRTIPTAGRSRIAKVTGPVPARAALLVAAAAPLHLAVALGPGTAAGRSPLEPTGSLVLALAVAGLTIILLEAAVRTAYRRGLHRGRRLEQVGTMRLLHDSAVQTLEGILLLAQSADLSAEERLRLVTGSAGREVGALRETLRAWEADRYGPFRSRPVPELVVMDLPGVVASVTGQLVRAGVEVNVDPLSPSTVRLPRPQAEALRLGTREALVNVARHAGATTLRVSAVQTGGRVEVLVEDDGRGFSRPEAEGFGISHSIVGRLTEVDGGADIRSGAGGGTSVRMWVWRGS